MKALLVQLLLQAAAEAYVGTKSNTLK